MSEEKHHRHVSPSFISNPAIFVTILSLAFLAHLTFEYNRMTLELTLESAALNNTLSAETDLLFFNRVPKVGSQTLISLLRRMQQFNNYTHYVDDPDIKQKHGERTLLRSKGEKITYCDMFARNFTPPTSYSKHIAFFDFKDCGEHYKQPIYMNFVREPVQRVISWYYYVRAPWYAFTTNENSTKYLEMKPGPYTSPHFYKVSYEECVLERKKECIYDQGLDHINSGKAGSHFSQMMFFCGSEEHCLKINDPKALSTAVANVEKHFAVVGVLEEMEKSLLVLERFVPRFFKGVLKEYNRRHEFQKEVNKNIYRPKVSQTIKDLVRRNMTREVEFYEFCKQRLHRQYLAAVNGS